MTSKEGSCGQRVKHLRLLISKVEAFLDLNGLMKKEFSSIKDTLSQMSNSSNTITSEILKTQYFH